MGVEVEILRFGFRAVVYYEGKPIGEMLGITIHHLYLSLYEVYGIDLFGSIHLN